MIKIGDKVKCMETGFEGVVTSRAEYLSGRCRFGVRSALPAKEGKPVPEIWFDEKLLAIIEPKSMSIG